ncbi:MAG: glycosyltransferase family 39 protein [Actinomycetota bacterium]|nr:glycosyltransferase family 39 protein [Actinomycetota bacterium]
MLGEVVQKGTRRSGEVRSLVSNPPWHGLSLAAILILSAFLNLYGLTGEGYSNNYYSAAVKNMLTSWSNFFFVSFDAGFVSVDKPPLGLWIQAASAWLFGFSGLSLLLPQAIAGVLSVALIYHLVRRTFGPVAGLLSALVLAITPIIVATSRNNTMDMLVVLFILLAAWAFVAAAERGSLSLLLLGAALVGLGFNTKTLQAFLVLPAFYLLYLLAARASWQRRFVHLGVATVVLLAVSLSWALAVDLTPSEVRPYVGGSEGDSALNLAFGYNGLERLLGRSDGPGGPPPGGASKAGDGKAAEKSPDAKGGSAPKGGPGGGPGGGGPGGVGENGEPGPLRLLNQQNAGQIGWLLPLAVVGLVAAGWQRRPRLPLDRQHAALVMWGTWLFTAAAYFSVSGYGHRHYLVMLAPAVAALVGIGAVALWKDYRSPGWRGWLLPPMLVGMAAVQAYVLFDYALWRAWLIPTIAGLCLVAAGILALVRLRPPFRADTYAVGAATAGILALLVAPAAWAAYDTLSSQGGGGLPAAGPRPIEAEGGPGGPGGPPGGGPGGPGGREADPVLLEYLQANKGDATYLVAGPSSMPLSPIILGTDEPVINLGGFMGRDPVFTTQELAGLVGEGAVRFFLVQDRERMEEMQAEREAEQEASGGSAPQGPPPGSPPGMDNEAVTWVQDNCEKVPEELWKSPEEAEEQGGGPGGPGGPGRVQALYDCSGAGGQ